MATIPNPLRNNNSSKFIFISHANPEDNHFAKWLSLQLAKEGYPVWCDLTRLLGGEDFWADIETALRNRTIKFLYALSRASNEKQGTLQELSLAQSVARQQHYDDFIIPLLIDDLPYHDFNIQLARLNAISFNTGWAPGLTKLLEKLHLDKVPIDTRFSPSTVNSWWTRENRLAYPIRQIEEIYVSNWYKIDTLPEHVHLHTIPAQTTKSQLDNLRIPYSRQHQTLLCFENELTSNQHRGSTINVLDTTTASTSQFVNGGLASPFKVEKHEARAAIVELLKKAWQAFALSCGMKLHSLSNRQYAAYFPDGFTNRNYVTVPLQGGGTTKRQLVGFRTSMKRKNTSPNNERRYWHFAVEVRPGFYPTPILMVIPHIVISNDGREAIPTTNRSRKSITKDWWNAHWRDRTLGLISWLSSDQSHIEIPLGPNQTMKLNSFPITFRSPVSY